MTQGFVIAIGLVFALFGAVLGLSFFTESVSVVHERVFDPLHEDNRRTTFEHSRAYREGMAQELQAMQIEYTKASSEQKLALGSIILHRVAGMPAEALPAHLRTFVETLRSERGFR